MMKTAFRIGLIVLSLMSMAFYARAEDEAPIKVNIVLDDGTVMLYAGSKRGITQGDTFKVTRDGVDTGRVVAVRVTEKFSYCQILSGSVKEMDEAVVISKGAPKPPEQSAPPPPQAKTPPAASSESSETSSAAKAPDAAKTAKTPPASGSSSSKAGSASSAGKAPGASSGKSASPAKTSSGGADQRQAPPPSAKNPEKTPSGKSGESDAKRPPAEEKKQKKKDKPIGGVYAAATGLTGLFQVPTADVAPDGDITARMYYIAANDTGHQYKDMGYGFDYGAGGGIEFAATRVNTRFNSSLVPAGLKSSMDTTIISFKYQAGGAKAPGFLSSAVAETKYAGGLNYYSAGVPANAVVNGTASTSKSTATRLFAVGSGRYNPGAGHVGLYYQNGGMLSGTKYKGLGFMGGLEYPFGGAKNAVGEGMTLLAEFDSKDFYLGTKNDLTFGLRYAMGSAVSLSLGIADVTSSKIAILNAGYKF